MHRSCILNELYIYSAKHVGVNNNLHDNLTYPDQIRYYKSHTGNFAMNFRTLHLINPIIRAVTEAGYSRPTEMQCEVIPAILEGRDVIGYAEPGTEKTAAFIMPVLQLLKKKSAEHNRIRALILVPTKERVLQMEDHLNLYSKYLPLSQLSVFGGIEATGQLAALKNRIDILIATPERLMELIEKRSVDLSGIEIMVADEADRMLEEQGCEDKLRHFVQLMPKRRQVVLFSETMLKNIQAMAAIILRNPIQINITNDRGTAVNIQQPADFIKQEYTTGLLLTGRA
ncbi:DEAD/DEAH box helicase [uncultured Chryseobacterium sp.]|uniref:DEAD/DEAH box helicase n=1 Tax=uncultured Chryseobacterium sp. TaxID=259322 RepID=UPI0025D88545|nr:DEAD/DEAH box helicase [uncultured Chryseobacterium sp.]